MKYESARIHGPFLEFLCSAKITETYYVIIHDIEHNERRLLCQFSRGIWAIKEACVTAMCDVRDTCLERSYFFILFFWNALFITEIHVNTNRVRIYYCTVHTPCTGVVWGSARARPRPSMWRLLIQWVYVDTARFITIDPSRKICTLAEYVGGYIWTLLATVAHFKKKTRTQGHTEPVAEIGRV